MTRRLSPRPRWFTPAFRRDLVGCLVGLLAVLAYAAALAALALRPPA